MTAPELSLVMPVHDEAGAIEDVVREWRAVLQRLGVRHELIVLDDGSRDGTGAVLDRLAAELPELRVLRHANRGHGPTILRGYREARGEWVFQSDSDGEIGTGDFEALWARRHQHDLIVGRRENRSAPLLRRVITAASRWSVAILFGRGIHDVNVPYRLVRRTALQPMVDSLPADLFAPNVILSGLAVRCGLRIAELPVEHRGRRQGRSSLGRFRVLRPAARSLAETMGAAWRMRGRSGRG
jgi:glycosyltransferase involved in cell wall biosynthesis